MGRLFSIVLVLLTGTIGIAARQVPSGAVGGTISDTQGGVIPGATVTIQSDARSRSVITNASGRYRITGLLPGRYAVQVAMAGFQTREAVVMVPSGELITWDAVLLVEGMSGFPGRPTLENKVLQFTGSEALDCGRHDMSVTVSMLQRSLECALEAAQLHRPFSVIVAFSGMDSSLGRGLMARADGRIFLFRYDAMGSPQIHASP
jgi:hypothetical protein